MSSGRPALPLTDQLLSLLGSVLVARIRGPIVPRLLMILLSRNVDLSALPAGRRTEHGNALLDLSLNFYSLFPPIRHLFLIPEIQDLILETGSLALGPPRC